MGTLRTGVGFWVGRHCSNREAETKNDMRPGRPTPGVHDGPLSILVRRYCPAHQTRRLMPEAPLESLVQDADAGSEAARAELFALLYHDLRRMAQKVLNRDGPHLTISPTTVLHETYLAICKRHSVAFPDPAHFMAYAAKAMRGLVIDYARSRLTQKRGAGFHITCLPTEAAELAVDDSELQHIADAVDALSAVQPRLAQVVDLKYFCGYTFADIAAMYGLSERTVQRDWDQARLFLYNEITER
jgi:RNA polymerase sigma factor (TIGR02999 family)